MTSITQTTRISIHAPRVGSDDVSVLHRHNVILISIHAPRVGSDLSCMSVTPGSQKFQSTLPVWGATRALLSVTRAWIKDFNPRSPCGERHGWITETCSMAEFQSTLPVWGAT